MSVLIKKGFNLKEVVEKFETKGLKLTEKQLLELEEDKDLRVFGSAEEVFFWINDSYSGLSEVVSQWLALNTKELAQYETMLDYALRNVRCVILDDGSVVYIYPL